MVDLHAFSSTYAFTCNKARYHLQTPHAGAVLYLSGTLQSIQLPLEKIFVSHARVGIHSKTGELLQHTLQIFGDSRYARSVAGNPKASSREVSSRQQPRLLPFLQSCNHTTSTSDQE